MRGSGQHGIALFISLVMLMLLTIVGVAAVQTTQLQTRMARNAHDNLIASQAAERALREGERFLLASRPEAARYTPAGIDGLWRPADFGEAPVWQAEAVWAEGGAGSRQAGPVTGAIAAPRYLIEWLTTLTGPDHPHLLEQSTVAAVPRTAIFRITARGFGATRHARAQLQSTFAVRLPPGKGP
ncbi:MAG: PilX N-terminal domain-containing pilus assembly protein [Gammaproteobacteria bacterium]|nr:PilX N-terminal domain-containing pilus assembly protein [Gammaproteobacteria bacterium]